MDVRKATVLAVLVVGIGVWYFTSQYYKKQLPVANNTGDGGPRPTGTGQA